MSATLQQQPQRDNVVIPASRAQGPRLLDRLRDAVRVRHYGLMIYTLVLPTGPLGVASPADTPDAGTDVGLMLRQMETLMRKLAPLADSVGEAASTAAAASVGRAAP